MKIGNKLNSFLNGEWARHGGTSGKKVAAAKRRQIDKKIIAEHEKDERDEKDDQKNL